MGDAWKCKKKKKKNPAKLDYIYIMHKHGSIIHQPTIRKTAELLHKERRL